MIKVEEMIVLRSVRQVLGCSFVKREVLILHFLRKEPCWGTFVAHCLNPFLVILISVDVYGYILTLTTGVLVLEEKYPILATKMGSQIDKALFCSPTSASQSLDHEKKNQSSSTI